MKKILWICCILLCCNIGQATAQNKKARKAKKKDKTEAKKDDEKKDKKDLLKTCVKQDGLFTMYQDTTNGSAYLGIREDQLDKDFIYFSYTENGPIWTFHVRGVFRENKVFTIRKHYDRIEFVTQNTSFYFDEENAISRAADANITEAIMVSTKIEKTDEKEKIYYIKADDLFLSEKIAAIKPTPPSGPNANKAFNLGKMSKDKTKYRAIRNYPENTEIVVDYVYENAMPRVRGGAEITDARYITITYQHTFIEVPKNGYKPRRDDGRVGYFMDKVTDLTSTSSAPYRDVIHRWNLEKKDPDAALSEPIKPITWWIENTTPQDLRPTIKSAVLSWNKAFEKAGFKNAVVVKEQPDDAEWDAGDIRYNVLRWTSSPVVPWGGYGPSFVNPLTGEILGADVMLEYVFVKNNLRSSKLFETAGMGVEAMGEAWLEENELSEGLPTMTACDPHTCTAAHFLQMNNMMGSAYLKTVDSSDEDIANMLKEALHYLLLHEVGHTLGLNHNMKATNLHSPEEAHNKAKTTEMGLYGSVMDYPAINIANDKAKQGQFYTTTPGPYDHWAIEYGYSTGLEDEKKEEARLNKILERSSDPALTFGNDADDMRGPGRAIDPRVMIFDMSNDPIRYTEERIQLVKNMLPKLKDKFTKEGESYQELLFAYYATTGQLWGGYSSVSRFIGGVYVDRSVAGQKGETQPFTPVAYEDQKRAMNLLKENLFSPNAFDEPKEIYNYLQRQRRGFDFFGKNEDPQLYGRFTSFYKGILAHLLHPNVLKRLTDSELYGNQYSVFEMTNDLTAAIFQEDLNTTVNPYRQHLQLDYVKYLLKGVSSKSPYDNVAKSSLLYQIHDIKKMLSNNKGTEATKAHRMHVLHLIDQTLEKK